MKLLVTGASGFVGGKLIERARAVGGWETFGVGRRPLPNRDYASLDVSRPFSLNFDPEVVVHAAARSSPWGSRAEFLRHNVEGTRHVIDFCARHGRPKLIYISSSSVFYRNVHQFDLRETSPIGPGFVNIYAETKFGGEELVRRYAGPWAILRPRAVFGPGDTVLFPRILRAARAGRLPYFTTDGPPAVGDLIYIDSLSDYILRTARDPAITGDFNLTNAEPIPIMALLLEIFRELGIPAPRRKLPVHRALALAGAIEAVYRALPFLGEPPITRFGVGVFAYSKTFDVRKALAALGPPSVPLREGIARFVAWQRAQPV
ncbi:MAG: NAD-dependent epimerase/dehydratase family protein [Opitutaceae bacterium]|nr:NAD-dependent epimerase/dehydratase family protein [Opitutaceae bacterium]